MMEPRAKPLIDRRQFVEQVGGGLYRAALVALLGREWRRQDLKAEASPVAPLNSAPSPDLNPDLSPRAPHFSPRAKSVIHLFMNGGPSQMDLFDPKPELTRLHGQSYFDRIAGEVENPQAAGALMRSPFAFKRHGQSGMWVSEVMPHFARCVDQVTMIRSMFTTSITHEPSLFQFHSGRLRPGHPCLGSWVSYALGTENQNLPAYIVLDDPKGPPINRDQNWNSGYISPLFQGTRFRSEGAPVLDLEARGDVSDRLRALERDLIRTLDRKHQADRPFQPRLGARIATYELAARMQLEAADVLDLSQEDQGTLERYGIGQEETDSYGKRCLIARRLVERGVRFVQLFINGQIWDHHTGIGSGLRSASRRTDQPVAALLTDLQERGLMEEVLVIWGGEMGRLPIAQLGAKQDPAKSGRDHNKNAMVTWMAGAGVKRGHLHGETDELGLAAVRDRVSVPDFHATLLHLLGLDHETLAVNNNGLEERLTGVNECRVVREILA